MDEARQLLARLERIEELRASAAEPSVVLDELRGLLRDGEAWALAEGVSAVRARRALAGLDTALAAGVTSSGDAAQSRDGEEARTGTSLS